MTTVNINDEEHKELKKIIKKKIPYPQNLVIPAKKKIILNKTPALSLLELRYPPISINDMPKTRSDDYLRYAFETEMLNFYVSTSDVNSLITKTLFKHNFQIMDGFHALQPPEPLVAKQDLHYLERINKNHGGNLDISFNFDILYEDKFGVYSIILGTKRKPMEYWSFSIPNEDKPITILRGFEEMLGPSSKIMPPTAMHVCNKSEIENQLKLFNISSLQHRGGDLPPYRYISYYLRNSLVKFGSIYWLVKKREKVYLYDLSSSFQIKPYVNGRNAELSAAKNAVGLLYYYSAKQCFMKSLAKHFKVIQKLIYRALKLIDEERNPVEYSLAYVIFATALIPDNLITSNQNVLVVRKDQEGLLKMVMKNENLSDDFGRQLNDSTNLIKKCLEFIINRLSARTTSPFKTVNWTFNNYDFSLNIIIKELCKIKLEDVGQNDYKSTVLDPFMKTYSDDWEYRTLVYLLRKLFYNFFITAMLNEEEKSLGISFAYLRICLNIWNVLNGVLSPTEPLPLPLEPLLRMGEISYRFSRDWDSARRECRKCETFYEEKRIKFLDEINSNKEDLRCCLRFPEEIDDFKLQFAELSFKYFARAVLNTDVKANHKLLVRICHVANDISNTLLANCQESSKNFISGEESKIHLKRISKFIKIAIKFSLKAGDGKSLLMAFCNRARYMKTYYHFHKFLKLGEHNTKKFIKHFNKIIIEYQRGASFLTDRLKMSIEVRNAFIWDFTQFLLEYIAKLKEMEIRDKKYYHKTILSIYQLVIVLADFCKKYSGYFRLRVPCTQALVAEYLFDIYRITKLTDVRDTAELWYQKCLSTLKRIEEKPVTELLKLILDVGNFYETLLKDMSPKVSLQERNKYYDQILEVLFQSKAALHKLRSKNWKYQRVTSYTVFTSTSATNILLLALHGKLRNTFEMRLFRRINENLNDITIKEYDQLLLLIRNYKNELLLDNLNDVLEMAENYFFSYRVKNIFLICRV